MRLAMEDFYRRVRHKTIDFNRSLFLVFAITISARPTQGVTSTCNLPSVAEGHEATLTCQFNEDLSNLSRNFKVVHVSNTSQKPENVLLCYWSAGVAQCQAHRDYSVVGNVTNTLTLKMQRASKGHTGRYLCHAFQSAPEEDESCNFSLKEVKSSCESPSVSAGDNATLTCRFDNDVRKLQLRVRVVHHTNDKTESVLLCAWYRGEPVCQTKDGYTLVNGITDTVHLLIPRARPDHSGAYQCHAYQSHDGVDEICNFKVTGLHIDNCERSGGLISIQENVDTVIKCSDINNTCLEDGRHNVIWNITHADGNSVLLGSCGCASCRNDKDGFRTPDIQGTISSLTIPSNYRILQNDTLQCSGEADNKSASCNLRGVYLAKIESCSISSKGLNANGSCNISKVYASDGNYSCLWRKTVKNDTENLTTAMKLSEFTEKNGFQYYNGHCAFYWDTMSTLINETFIYSVSVTPGPGWSVVDNITIAPPPTPPTITGYTEGQPILLGNTLTLTCTVTGGVPAVSSVTFFCGQHADESDTIYENTNRSLVAVISKVTIVNVSVADNGIKCSCKANWAPQQDLFQMVTSIILNVVESIDGQGSTLQQTTSSPTTIPYTYNTFLQPSTTSTLWTESNIVNQNSSTTFSTKDTSKDDNASSKTSGGTTEAIIGGVIGAVAFIIVVVVVVIIIKRRSGSADTPKRTQSTTSDDGVMHTNNLYEAGSDTPDNRNRSSPGDINISLANIKDNSNIALEIVQHIHLHAPSNMSNQDLAKSLACNISQRPSSTTSSDDGNSVILIQNDLYDSHSVDEVKTDKQQKCYAPVKKVMISECVETSGANDTNEVKNNNSRGDNSSSKVTNPEKASFESNVQQIQEANVNPQLPQKPTLPIKSKIFTPKSGSATNPNKVQSDNSTNDELCNNCQKEDPNRSIYEND